MHDIKASALVTHVPPALRPTCHFRVLLNLLHKAPEYAQGRCGAAEGIICCKRAVWEKPGAIYVPVPLRNLLESRPLAPALQATRPRPPPVP